MGNGYAGEAILEALWLIKISPRDEVCRDCWAVVMKKGERQYIMVGALSYDPKAKPIRCEKPVCEKCFQMRRNHLGQMLKLVGV